MTDSRLLEALHYETGEPVRIEIDGGLIKEISGTGDIKGGLSDVYVAPGFIDNQVNGYFGVDFSEGGLTAERLLNAVNAINKDGVTSFMPTFITNSHKNLLRNFTDAGEALKNDQLRDSIPGFHLEGPYISSEYGYYGTHPLEHVRKPDWDEFSQYQMASGGYIKLVTIAPETEGAIDFIEKCTNNNILVSIGHSNASAEVINLAVQRGARLATHLGNGLANMIDRHRNPVWPQLANDMIIPSIIADGYHLLPEEVKVFYKIKGPDNIFLISDVSPLIGMPPGTYNYLGSEVVYTKDGFLRNPKMNCLAGASQPIRRGVEKMIEYTGCSLAQAINMATKNVARACHLYDRGILQPGKRADLILFKFKDNKLVILKTIVKGRIAFQN